MSDAQYALFARGVLAALSAWPALVIALQLAPTTHTETSDAIQQRLALELLDAFISAHPSLPEPTQVQDFLKEFVQVELEVLLEDDSEKNLASDLQQLWQTCTTAPEAEARQAVEQLEAKVAKGVQVSRAPGENDGDTDEDSEGSDDDDDDKGDGMQVDAAEEARSTKAEPIIDEDGFETVVRRKR